MNIHNTHIYIFTPMPTTVWRPALTLLDLYKKARLIAMHVLYIIHWKLLELKCSDISFTLSVMYWVGRGLTVNPPCIGGGGGYCAPPPPLLRHFPHAVGFLVRGPQNKIDLVEI